MRLDSARALKRELVAATVDFLAKDSIKAMNGRRTPLSAGRALSLRRGGLEEVRPAMTGATGGEIHLPPIRSTAAVGITRGLGSNAEYRLAVRVFAGSQPLFENTPLARLSARDADIVRGVRYRPRLLRVTAGTSCGHVRITAGTLGGFVEKGGHPYILSNNHVLANSGVCAVGDEIIQPGRIDATPSKRKVIGHLQEWSDLFAPVDAFDAALATFSDEVDDYLPWEYEGIGEIVPRLISDRLEVRSVTKLGRTTGITRGRVSAFELDDIELNYGTDRRPRIGKFSNQIEIVSTRPRTVPFSLPGDSGSFVIDRESMRPYALLYGGGPDDDGIDRTLCHFLPDVLASLGAKLIPK
jgi:hypothetical protein